MRRLLILVFCYLPITIFCQSGEPWIRFSDTKTRLSGYRDLQGSTRISAGFESFTKADTFRNIIAVYAKENGVYAAYFLLKSGRKTGFDSLDVYNYRCESEEKILFTNLQTSRVGFLNKNGEVIIPAVLNEATDFRNGMSVVLRNAVRKCYDEFGGDTTDCERLGWFGGEKALINENNETLVTDWNIEPGKIDWFSMRVNDATIDTNIYVPVNGTNGNVYSFLHYQKEFNQWFLKQFLPSLNNGPISSAYLMHHLNAWSEKTGWITITKEEFSKKYGADFKGTLFRNDKFHKLYLSNSLTEPFSIDPAPFRQYLTPCGEWDKERYPLFIIVVEDYKKSLKGEPAEIETIRHYEFFRTADGYKIINVPLPVKK